MGPRIGRFMTLGPRTIGAKEMLAAAHQAMRTHDIRHLPVLDGSRLVGLISQRDLYLIETLKGVDPAEVMVEEAMSDTPFVIDPEASLARVVREMAKHKCGCAVVADRGEVVGVFTTTDALRVLDALLTEKSKRSTSSVAAPTARRRART